MSKSDKFIAGVVLGALVLNWLKQFRFDSPQSGADTPTRDPDIIDETTGIGYYLVQSYPIGEQWWESLSQPEPIEEEWWKDIRQPDDPLGPVRRVGTMLSTEAPVRQPATPTTPTTSLSPGYTLIQLSGQSDVSEINGLVRFVQTKDGPRPYIDKDEILRIHVVTSTGCA